MFDETTVTRRFCWSFKL